MKHKHYDLILAWANGEKIEYNNHQGITGFQNWTIVETPMWKNSVEYRVFVEPEKTLYITGNDGKQRGYKQPITDINVAIQLLSTSTLYYSSIDSMCYYICISKDYLVQNNIRLDTLCSRGILHKTRENAIQHTYAMLSLDYIA